MMCVCVCSCVCVCLCVRVCVCVCVFYIHVCVTSAYDSSPVWNVIPTHPPCLWAAYLTIHTHVLYMKEYMHQLVYVLMCSYLHGVLIKVDQQGLVRCGGTMWRGDSGRRRGSTN